MSQLLEENGKRNFLTRGNYISGSVYLASLLLPLCESHSKGFFAHLFTLPLVLSGQQVTKTASVQSQGRSCTVLYMLFRIFSTVFPREISFQNHHI